MDYFVGAVSHSSRYGIDLGTVVLTDIANDVVENECFMVKYFPGARLQIMIDEGEVSTDKSNNWIVEYSDSSNNIAIGIYGIRDMPITEDLIGIFNTDSGQYAMMFELYKKAE